MGRSFFFLTMESDDDDVLGPMPASEPTSTAHDGARALAEREARQKEAVAREAKQDTSSTRRPDWMLSLPTSPTGPTRLCARGFQQSRGRAQHVVGENAAEAQRLWTETPEQRRDRILRGESVDHEQLPTHAAQHARDAAIRERLGHRPKSLVEQHKDRRREDSRRERRRHHHHHHHHSRSRSPRRRKTRAEREEEDRQLYGDHAPLLFDKDKVLGAGSRLMDERARAKSIADASQLSTRFSNGQSGSFL